jgi:hypothetical protein
LLSVVKLPFRPALWLRVEDLAFRPALQNLMAAERLSKQARVEELAFRPASQRLLRIFQSRLQPAALASFA